MFITQRHNAFLASVDSWLTDIMYPNSEPDSPISSTPNVIIEESTVSKRISFQKKMFLYTNLILLHRPYVNDFVQSRNSTRPSYDICTFAAIIITDLATKLEASELIYHSKSPITAYALIMALRIHIMNASTNPNNDKFNSEKNFAQSVHTLEKLPQCQISSSLLYTALDDLREQYNNRFILSQEREEEIRLKLAQSQAEQLTITTAEAIFNPGSTEKRKERSSSAPSSTESIIGGLAVKQYQPPDEATTIKKKKLKTMVVPPQQHISVSSKQKQKQKQKQIQQSHQRVFSTLKSPRSSIENQLIPQQQQQQVLAEQNQDFLQSKNTIHSQNTPMAQDILQPQSHELTHQQDLLQQQLHYGNSNSINEYPYQQYFSTPDSYASNSMSSSTNGINSNIQYSHIDYSILQQQQEMLNPMLYPKLLDEDLNFDNFGVDGAFNSGSNDLFSDNNIDDIFSTWFVESKKNAGVSVTPVNNGSSQNV